MRCYLTQQRTYGAVRLRPLYLLRIGRWWCLYTADGYMALRISDPPGPPCSYGIWRRWNLHYILRCMSIVVVATELNWYLNIAREAAGQPLGHKEAVIPGTHSEGTSFNILDSAWQVLWTWGIPLPLYTSRPTFMCQDMENRVGRVIYSLT